MREATKRAIAVAKESGAVISFDPNLRPPLWKSLEDARVQVAYGPVSYTHQDVYKRQR